MVGGSPLWHSGTYTVKVTYGTGMSTDTFDYNVQINNPPMIGNVTRGNSTTGNETTMQPISTPSKIPSWVRHIFIYYGQGNVSEDELLNAIKFLINQGIMKLS